MSYSRTKALPQYVFYLVIVIVGFGGCSINPPITNQTAKPYVFDSPTPEYSPSVILTATLLHGLTRPPTPEYPKLVTPRVTPLPTRSLAEVKEGLSYMLHTNGNCTLPCFWGIQPDQTRYDELYGILDRFGGSRFETLQENSHLRVSPSFTKYVEFQADLQDDTVKDLKVLLLNLSNSEITPADWSAYNMDEVLRTYGVPDTVELYFSGPSNSLALDIRLKYENIHTTIMYFGSTTEIDKYQTPSSVIFCPEEIGVDFVELHIGKHPFDNEPNGVPLSKATGMDEQTFHKLFTENPSACLTLNRKAFYP